MSGDAATCGACGASLSATLASVAADSSRSGTPRPAARFEAGSMLGGRYRIVGLLGRGGMGEVYRADDLELGQAVALKFLPEALASDAAALDRFRAEVRTARQVAHPNVCRTYDIGNVDGHVFISMEFIDGEDMASALRRMGPPSAEKAYEIARQLCLGMAAAHENGVLHRDLKPANVMIDGRGRVRITDFGLAGLIEEFDQGGSRAGTPAYMAPEQLDRGAVSVRSDIYALGLVLHELFTGKRVFNADTVAELREQHASSSLTASSSSPSVDPAVERLVLQCLEQDPKRRPSSVYAVLGALPGGDPIAAAIAAGETPSPDLVAAAGRSDGVAPRWAVAMVIGALLSFALATALQAPRRESSLVSLPVSPIELEIRARDLLVALGHERPSAYSARGLESDQKYREWIRDHDGSVDRWDRLRAERPSPARSWHRYADQAMEPAGAHQVGASSSNPPVAAPGSGLVELDPAGRLLGLRLVPRGVGGTSSKPLDLASVFEHAGLDFALFEPVALLRPAPVFCEARAFSGPSETDLAERLIVQLGIHEGRLSYFELLWPWDLEESASAQGEGFNLALWVATLAIVMLLAHRNLKLGRGDRVGAFRLAAFVILCYLSGALLTELHPLQAPVETLDSLINGKAMAHALLHAALTWLAYVALEPHARKLWPRTLVTWTRVLRGRFQDEQVGRDVLLGVLVAGVSSLGREVADVLSRACGIPDRMPPGSLRDWSVAGEVGSLFSVVSFGLLPAMMGLTVLVAVRMLARGERLTIILVLGLGVTLGTVAAPAGEGPDTGLALVLGVADAMLFFGLCLFVLLRLGLWTAVVAVACSGVLSSAPLTADLTRWYAGPALVPLALFAVLLLWAFRSALGGRALFQGDVAEN